MTPKEIKRKEEAFERADFYEVKGPDLKVVFDLAREKLTKAIAKAEGREQA